MKFLNDRSRGGIGYHYCYNRWIFRLLYRCILFFILRPDVMGFRRNYNIFHFTEFCCSQSMVVIQCKKLNNIHFHWSCGENA